MLNQCANVERDVNIVDKNGCTALHYAAKSDQFSLAKLLVNFKASPEITDDNGQVPHKYASKDNDEMQRLLGSNKEN